MEGSQILQSLIAAAGLIVVILIPKLAISIFTSPGSSRGARIGAGVVAGLLVGGGIYFASTDLIGAIVGAIVVAGWLLYRRSSRPKADFVVRDDVLLDEAVSPELGADLEDFARQLEGGTRVSEASFEVPDLPPMPSDSIRPRL